MFPGLCCAVLLTALDTSVVATALPNYHRRTQLWFTIYLDNQWIFYWNSSCATHVWPCYGYLWSKVADDHVVITLCFG
jgi:hypothetical protein